MAKTVVVAMDLSPASTGALEEALPIARRMGASINMVHATPMPEHEPAYEWVNPGMVELYREAVKEDFAKTRSILGDIRQRHAGQGVELSLSFVTGDAEHAISEAADECDAELIVVGSHGRTGLDRILLGSVAERISRFTDRDVLVARSETHSGYKRVLVPTDFSQAADHAFEVALKLAAEGATITLLHAIDVPSSMAGFLSSDVIGNVRGESQRRADEIAARGKDSGFKVEVVVAQGYPPSVIREHAGNRDLVIMGSHGRRGLRRFLLGSVAEKTIRHAPCSVYIARAKAA